MKPNELRIGSVVNIYKQPETIEYLHQVLTIEECGCNIHCGEESDMIPFCEISPVKLTAEWIELFQFAKHKYKFGQFHKDFLLLIYDEYVQLYELVLTRIHTRWFEHGIEAFIMSPDCNGGNFYVSYVHQLQNIYFALTGKELIK